MIKVEVIGDDETLLPDPFETYEACKVLLEKAISFALIFLMMSS